MDNTVLELLEKEKYGLKTKNINSIVYQTLKGLNHLHKNNIIHRDIKPENLLVDRKGILKICDFGFARIFQDFPLTNYVSTRWYRSPELLLYDGEYEKPADIWGLGCVMAELIDGNPLFEGNDQIHQLNLICKLFGAFPPTIKSKIEKNKNLNLKIPLFKKTNSLENKYKNGLDKNGLDLLKRMLILDPNWRITAKEALSHPFFNDIRTTEIKKKINQEEIIKYDNRELVKNTKERIKEIKKHNNPNIINNNINYNFYQINIDTNKKKTKEKMKKIESIKLEKNNKFNLTIQKTQNVLNKKEIMLLSTVKPPIRSEEQFNDRRISMNKYGNYYSNFKQNQIKPIKMSSKKEMIKKGNNHKFIIQSKIINNNKMYTGSKSIEKYLKKQNILPNIKNDFKKTNPYKIPYKNYY